MAIEPLADWEKELLGVSSTEEYEATIREAAAQEWKPINHCSRVRPHTGEMEQWMNDEMNRDHMDPDVPFKTDWDVLGWDTIRVFNNLY